ncbi:MAG: glycogen debranching enzyme GlgX [Rhizobiales bacterium]|nr:glycogen debranching enzyme GlgX [Hyphomicrobiales bacterium]MBA68533.1 glycogen debranching enzyme GlgX [Hyphomicrobiales bacterium]|tara:strand:+ start:1308 stop:3278 length:1971 start_codon:yes stop_codon:yes gene_type:complete
MARVATKRTPGTRLTADGALFAVRAPHAEAVHVCLFDPDDRETTRHRLNKREGDLFSGEVAGIKAGHRYGLRAEGPWDPDNGHRFDPSKLLVDPYAVRLDRPFHYDPRLGEKDVDTASIVPKAIVEAPQKPYRGKPHPPRPGGVIYEVPVRAFTMLHPDIPAEKRGTLAALTHPAIIDHLRSLHVSAIELMPIAAWIDERHLPPLGLTNAWGYNPVTMLALDPRIAPGGIAELRALTTEMHKHGIGVLVDVVYNHTGESDLDGPTLSLRGLGNKTFYAHDPDHPGRLINDTGCGNTLACHRPEARELVIAAMRHLALQGGVDGFRFDLAPVLGRDGSGFSADAEMLAAMHDDAVLKDRLLVAEPWDIGPGGYQLGNFPEPWLEWNDRARDDIRTFWRGDPGKTGDLATRLSGSSDIFGHGGATATRSVNFIAAHDGFPLGDLVRYAEKHNEANGEDNRDGHNENYSWNCGVEGETDDPDILAAREADATALIATLFASRGTLLLTAGDEFGHTQHGNNNAYAQDNEMTWRDWSALDPERLEHARTWADIRARSELLNRTGFLVAADGSDNPDQVAWLSPDGNTLEGDAWNDPALGGLVMVLGAPGSRVAVTFNRSGHSVEIALPESRSDWRRQTDSDRNMRVEARSVACFSEKSWN